MKGLMVALLTLLTAGFATAKQQGQNDEGGTFVLTLNAEQFEDLQRNPNGLIATIPEGARGNIANVVVKLSDELRQDDSVASAKPALPLNNSGMPSLQPSSGNQSTQSPFRAPPSRTNNGSNSSSIPDFNPPGRIAQAGGQPLGGNTTQPWLEFGDDTDFIPVVKKNDWIQPRQRANHLTNNDFGRELGDFRNTTPQTNNQNFPNNNFNSDTTFQNRDRTLDVARRDPVQNNFNNLRGSDPNRIGQVQPTTQNDALVQSMQDRIQQDQNFIELQKQAVQNKQNEIDQLKYQLAQAEMRQNNPLYQNSVGHPNRNYQQPLNGTEFDAPSQHRLAQNTSSPSTRPQITDVDNNTNLDDQDSTPDASSLVAQPSQELIGKNRDLAKANTFLLFMLLCSIGLNVYLGLIARSFYMRYAELADELRETFTATM